MTWSEQVLKIDNLKRNAEKLHAVSPDIPEMFV
jgi:hypothetical protein